MSRKVKSKATKAKRSRESKGRAEFTPVAGAGLIRFFREETEGLSIPPYLVIIISVILIVLVLSLSALLPL